MWEQKRKKEGKYDSKVFGMTKNGGAVGLQWEERGERGQPENLSKEVLQEEGVMDCS